MVWCCRTLRSVVNGQRGKLSFRCRQPAGEQCWQGAPAACRQFIVARGVAARGRYLWGREPEPELPRTAERPMSGSSRGLTLDARRRPH